MNVFVDTSAILSLLDPNDISHVLAAKVWRRLTGEKDKLLTTNYVVVETCSLLQARSGLQAVREFQAAIVPLLNIVWINEEMHKDALEAMLLANQRRLSLVDCSSMMIAKQYNIQSIFAFDRHFTERGFTCLIA
jgi:predicted nucleic acid-binding protein